MELIYRFFDFFVMFLIIFTGGLTINWCFVKAACKNKLTKIERFRIHCVKKITKDIFNKLWVLWIIVLIILFFRMY